MKGQRLNVDWMAVNWEKSDEEIAQGHGITAIQVYRKRYALGLFKRKQPTYKQFTDEQIAEALRKGSREAAAKELGLPFNSFKTLLRTRGLTKKGLLTG